jgi:hypothetical protein
MAAMGGSLLAYIVQPPPPTVEAPPPAYSSVKFNPEDLPAYFDLKEKPSTQTSCVALPPRPRRKKFRRIRSVHRHKTPNAYHDLPIFENPCTFCHLKYCRKVVVNWVHKQRHAYSAVTVSIDRLTSEQYEENGSWCHEATLFRL